MFKPRRGGWDHSGSSIHSRNIKIYKKEDIFDKSRHTIDLGAGLFDVSGLLIVSMALENKSDLQYHRSYLVESSLAKSL